MPQYKRKRSSYAKVYRKPYAKRSGNKCAELPLTALSYKGPIFTPADRDNNDLNTLVLLQTVQMTASATVLNNVSVFNNPQNCVDWSDYSSSWDQYRVLAMEFRYVPNSENQVPAAPLFSVIDRDTSTALVSLASAANYASMVSHTLDRPWRRSMKMAGVTEAQWFNTQGLPAAGGSIKLWSSGLANVNFGTLLIYYRVQFRGRGI